METIEEDQLDLFQSNPCGHLYQDPDGLTAHCTIPLVAKHEHHKSAKVALTQIGAVMSYCHADCDGDCEWQHCPQLRDGEPSKSHRHCPLDRNAERW